MVVYTQPSCGKCRILKMLLNGKGIKYREESDLEKIISLNIRSFPVIDLEDGSPLMLADDAIFYIQGM